LAINYTSGTTGRPKGVMYHHRGPAARPCRWRCRRCSWPRPTSAFAAFDGRTGAGDIFVAKAGVGPQDGFSGYKAFGNPARPRWGDYGATAVDGDTIWIAIEYIGQTCTLAEFTATPFGSCGGTRTTLTNWDTRISQIKP
jgi:acyl-CoA synthetase (AMP-forming)/AMP-acid ligase II